MELASRNSSESLIARGQRFLGKRKWVHQVAEQEMFIEMLRRERRRTERSGRPFLLVLISAHDPRPTPLEFPARKIAVALSQCTREIDFLGWFAEPNTLGLLVTEFGVVTNEVIEQIVERISTELQESLQAEIYCRLALVVRAFPRDGTDPVFTMDRWNLGLGAQIDALAKRTMDVAGSLLAIMAFSPVFVVIALLVKCTSKGPILYRKKRLGRNGREFAFYKFRTMHVDNDPEIHREFVSRLIAGGAEANQNKGLYKLANDPRVTRLGRFLRRTSLDELPQFFNVLFNDMSLVGPRPPLPYEYERYDTWHKRRVLEVKPGLTGLWQVAGRSRTTFDEMVRMDLHYANTRSLWLDLKLVLLTPAAMFSGRGAC